MASTILEQILENVSRGARLPRNGPRPAAPPPPAAETSPPTAEPEASAETDAPREPSHHSVEQAGALMRQVIEEMDNRLSSMVDQVLNHPALGKNGSTPIPSPTEPPIRSGFQPPVGAEGQTEAIDPTRVPANPKPSLGVATEAIDPTRVAAVPTSDDGKTETMDPSRIALLQERAKRARAIAQNAEAAKLGTLEDPTPEVAMSADPELDPEGNFPVPTDELPPAGPVSPVEPIDPAASVGDTELPPGELEPSTELDVDEIWEESENSSASLPTPEPTPEPSEMPIDMSVEETAVEETPIAEVSVEPTIDIDLEVSSDDSVTEEFPTSEEMSSPSPIDEPSNADEGDGERLLDLIQVPTSPTPPTVSPALQDSTVIEQVEAIVEEIAATCGTGTDFEIEEIPEDSPMGPALKEIRDLLAPLQSVPTLLEKAGAPQQQILRQMQTLAEEVRELARAPRVATDESSPAVREVEEKAQARRRVAIDDIQGMIQSLS